VILLLYPTSVLTHVFVFYCVNIYFGSSGAFSFLKIHFPTLCVKDKFYYLIDHIYILYWLIFLYYLKNKITNFKYIIINLIIISKIPINYFFSIEFSIIKVSVLSLISSTGGASTASSILSLFLLVFSLKYTANIISIANIDINIINNLFLISI